MNNNDCIEIKINSYILKLFQEKTSDIFNIGTEEDIYYNSPSINKLEIYNENNVYIDSFKFSLDTADKLYNIFVNCSVFNLPCQIKLPIYSSKELCILNCYQINNGDNIIIEIQFMRFDKVTTKNIKLIFDNNTFLDDFVYYFVFMYIAQYE